MNGSPLASRATDEREPPSRPTVRGLGGTAKRARRSFGRFGIATLPVLSGVVLAIVWQGLSWAGLLDATFFSSPVRIVSAGITQIQTGSFWNDVWVSVQEFLAGYLLALVTSIPFGLVVGWVRRARYFFEPWLNALNATPRIALFPLVVLWFGLGLESKVAVVFLGTFVSVAINTFHGTLIVAREHLDVATSFHASAWRRLVSVVVPTAVPFVLVGMRLGIGRAVTGVLVAEYFSSEHGLGHFVFQAGQTLQTGKLLFGAVFITGMALVGFRGIATVERRVSAWRPRVGSA